MLGKLQCIVVDADLYIHDVFREYLKHNEYAEILNCYTDPIEFMNAKIKTDLVFIDVKKPHIDGFAIANAIKPIPVILFTGKTEHFADILNAVNIIDAFAKPIIKERLLESVKKAYILLKPHSVVEGYAIFYTAKEWKNILLSSILFVKAVKSSHGNFEVYCKGGSMHIFEDYTIGEIHKKVGFLEQSNRSELISPEAVAGIDEDKLEVILQGISYNGKFITSSHLGTEFRKPFLARFQVI